MEPNDVLNDRQAPICSALAKRIDGQKERERERERHVRLTTASGTGRCDIIDSCVTFGRRKHCEKTAVDLQAIHRRAVVASLE